MSIKKGVYNKNDKGEWHGYNEWYWSERIYYPVRVNYRNDKETGYEENAWNKKTNFYIR